MGLTEWSETLPNDNGFAGDGDDEIVAAKAGIKERLELDHQFSGELDPLEGDCDGYHKKLTMKALSSDPTPLTGAGVLYTKLVDDIVELFFKDETTGVVNQLTEQGVLSLNTLANNIDADGHSILNLGNVQATNVQATNVQATNVQATVGFEGKSVQKAWSSTKVKSRTTGGSTSFTVSYPCTVEFRVAGESSFGGSTTYSSGYILLGSAKLAGTDLSAKSSNQSVILMLLPGTYSFLLNPQGTAEAAVYLISSFGYNGTTASEVIS